MDFITFKKIKLILMNSSANKDDQEKVLIVSRICLSLKLFVLKIKQSNLIDHIINFIISIG